MALGIKTRQDYYPDIIIFVFDLFSFKIKGIELFVKMHRDEVIYNSLKSRMGGTISHQSEWLRSKSLHVINAGEGVEKREPSYTVGGNAN